MLPWQSSQLEHLNSMLRAGKLPHALLFVGPDGTGKKEFAQTYAHKLLCENDNDLACGQCHACKVFTAQTHPDFITIAPADEGKQIPVDTIRETIEKLTTTSQFGGRTVAIIENAEQMNRNAANAILKTLEEPTPDTVIILVTSFPHRLLPTIRSRCQQIQFPVPETQQAVDYLKQQGSEHAELNLQISHGSPFKALSLADSEVSDQRKTVLKNLIKTARGQSISLTLKEIDKIPLKQLIDWSIDFCDDLIKVKCLAEQAEITHGDLADVLNNMAPHSQLQALYAFRDGLIERKKQTNIALNQQLLLEDLLINWQQAFAKDE